MSRPSQSKFLGFRELDSAMVMGTMMLLSMIATDQYDAENSIKFALLAFAWGGAMAGFAFAL